VKMSKIHEYKKYRYLLVNNSENILAKPMPTFLNYETLSSNNTYL
ncbi:2062_t:CDS:1, partial [Gigaspora rosea]